MATDDLTDNDYTATSTIMHETMTKLRELIDEARRFQAQRRADAGDGVKRQAFIDWCERAAVARGYLECLVTLNLLPEDDEIAWYEYLAGDRQTAPGAEDA